MENLFAPTTMEPPNPKVSTQAKPVDIPDYSADLSTPIDRALAFLLGFAAGFLILYIFYHLSLLALLGGVVFGIANIFLSIRRSIDKRRSKLRTQFFDLLEAMSVSMRAGKPVVQALESARDDLKLIYASDSDIMIEVNIIIGRFNNAWMLSSIFSDFAERSGLEDIASFASVYATIEGKSSRADSIIRDTQQIIADKMAVEMEIETMMTAAKSEVTIMLFMPLLILGIVGYAGAGFMDAIYTTPIGRLVATGGLGVFILSYFLAQKFSTIEL